MSINICPMVALAAELTNVPLWLCIPFACLLLCIAIIPLVKGEWWEKYRPFAVIFWSLLFIIPFAVKYGAGTAAETVLECLVNDYLTFIVLLFGLFCVAGNITVEGSLVGSPRVNVILLGIGTLLSSWIGTTGASMLLVRPVIKMNSWRIRLTLWCSSFSLYLIWEEVLHLSVTHHFLWDFQEVFLSSGV